MGRGTGGRGPWRSRCGTKRGTAASVGFHGDGNNVLPLRSKLPAACHYPMGGPCGDVPDRGRGVVTGGGSGVQALGGKGSAKHAARDGLVPGWYGARRSSAALCSMVGSRPIWPPERRTTCRGAVIALYGRTPRDGTAGHVAARRGLDRIHTARRPPRGSREGAAGSRALARRMEPVWTVVRREEAEARAEHPCQAGKQTRRPPKPRRAANRARGRCRQRHAAAAASDGSAKCVEGQLAAWLRIRDCLASRDDGSPITT